MKALIQIIRVVLTAVWAAVLAACVFLLAGPKDYEMPRLADWTAYTVLDSSMEPELSPGDVAVIHMGQAAGPGDAILYRSGAGQPVLSRMIGTTDGQLIFKADDREEMVLGREADVLGVCAGYLPGFGTVFEFLGSVPGIVVVVLAGFLLIVLPGFLLRPAKTRRKRTARPVEAERRPPARREAVYQEEPRREPLRRETAYREEPRREPPRRETAYREDPRREPPRGETVYREEPRREAAAQEPPKKQPSRGGYTPRH